MGTQYAHTHTHTHTHTYNHTHTHTHTSLRVRYTLLFTIPRQCTQKGRAEFVDIGKEAYVEVKLCLKA